MHRSSLLLACLMTMLLAVPASTQPPASLRDAAANTPAVEKIASKCDPGYYWCPGRVSGCCRNGWGCGSTRCIPPKKQPVRYGNCYWDGSRPICAGSCQPGFVVRKREGSGCITGSRVYCCEPMGSISIP